jgi:hypothetical protein
MVPQIVKPKLQKLGVLQRRPLPPVVVDDMILPARKVLAV